ncbi:MAG: DUF4142 domain-containing protein [Candidatus Eremiobacteraeota bacterium]|nr:DUF4142 domain-containing protein [Candidatus Eremiobacteraeota bacterium]
MQKFTRVSTALAAIAAAIALTAPAGAQLAGNTLATAADGKFAKAAIAAGNLEIDQAHAELKSTTDASVKLYAKTVIHDHTLINAELAGTAKGAGFTIPSNLRTPGVSISYEDPTTYMKSEVAAHEQAIAIFEKDYQNGSRQFQAITGPAIQTLKKHLAMAQQYLKTGSITQ